MNDKNSSRKNSAKPSESTGSIPVLKRKESSHAPPGIYLLSRLLRYLTTLTNSVSRLLRKAKKAAILGLFVSVAVLSGHLVSAQVPTISPLSKVKVPEPTNLSEFIKDKTAAIALGKSLFWDMQLGSDGIQSCASCHFHAGADSRSKNQINPGANGVFNLGGKPNYQLKATDYPFHKLSDPNNRASQVVSSIDDITGSQGVTRAQFVDVVPGSDKDKTTPKKDDVFNVQGINTRRVTDRNSPTVINAVFNFRNFWDGRAQNIFNGVNAFGARDKDAFILKAINRRRISTTKVRIDNSSLASQAVAPPLSAFETAAENDTVIAPFRVQLSEDDKTIQVTNEAGGSTGQAPAERGVGTDGTVDSIQESSNDTTNGTTNNTTNDTTNDTTKQNSKVAAQTRRPRLQTFGRKLGKKLLALTPLGKQTVAADDSVLGSLSKGKGLKVSYEKLIQDAFQPTWWDSNIAIRVNQQTGRLSFFRRPRNRPLRTNEYTLAEYNFSLFFGLAVQAYESTLISDQTPFDKFVGGNASALSTQQQNGWRLFQQKFCIACHAGSELTSASVTDVSAAGRIRRIPLPPPVGTRTVQDTGFFGIGVRPSTEDKGLGNTDPFGNSLSETQLAKEGKFQQIFGQAPPTLNPPLGQSNDILAVNGNFKTPGLRNVELTAPYFHNGGELTLEQVIDFYNRGGNFPSDAVPGIPPLNLTDQEKQDLVAFLKGLTDERVRLQKAPFDHPQLFVPNGHLGDQNSVTANPNIKTSDGTRVATDSLLQIPAVGRNGGTPLSNFLSSTP
jgi:cytochrome c peroxidase